jgi:hypothetical protein
MSSSITPAIIRLTNTDSQSINISATSPERNQATTNTPSAYSFFGKSQFGETQEFGTNVQRSQRLQTDGVMTNEWGAYTIASLDSALTSKSRKDGLSDALNNIFGNNLESINADFLNALAGAGGSGGVGFSAGSVDTEKSFNPLKVLATLKDGLVVKSLNSFFKVADIQDQTLKGYANELYKQDQWGGYSRAFDDLFIHALEDKGLSEEEMSTRISTNIAQTAKLLNEAIDSSGMTIDQKNRALATSFIATHFSIDKIADQLGLDATKNTDVKNGDSHLSLSDALLANPELLDDPKKIEILKEHLASSIKENYDTKLSQFSESYKGEQENLTQIRPGMLNLLNGKYKEDVMELNGGKMPSDQEISSFMSANGFKSDEEYFKIDNSEIAAQTYMNLKAIQHDYELLKNGTLTAENRMYNAAQTVLRSTPTAEHDGAAFDENNGGRKMTAVAGMNRDLVGNIALPFVSKDQMSTLLNQMQELGIELSAVDISHHGSRTGTTGFGMNDNALLEQVVSRMADGGEIVYNSCLTASGTENGGNNLAVQTLLTAAKDKGVKVHAADQSTIGYHEDCVYDAYSRNITNTPRKLDGIVGGYTIQEGSTEQIQDQANDSELRKNSLIAANN